MNIILSSERCDNKEKGDTKGTVAAQTVSAVQAFNSAHCNTVHPHLKIQQRVCHTEHLTV